MRWVTKDQLARARHFPVLDYILRYEASEYKRVGNGYRLRSDNAFAVDEKGWYCHRHCKGSKTALDYLVEIKGMGLVDAVCFLLNESPQERSGKAKPAAHKPTQNKSPPALNITPPPTSDKEPKPLDKPLLSLPIRNKDNRRVIAYLQSRNIDLGLIMDCIERGVLYECKYYHNAVFLGKDEHGKTRFAAMRSTEIRFMRDADGSDKKYGFLIPPNNRDTAKTATPRAVALFESPIEALSHQTMCLQGYLPPFDGWRLSLGGTSILGLKHFLEQNPQITHCVVCTNNDEAGDRVMGRVKELENPNEITIARSIPLQGNDWNNALEAAKKAERTQSNMRDCPQKSNRKGAEIL